MANIVQLSGTVKRDAEASASNGCEVLDFALDVVNAKGRHDIFDCRITSMSDAYEQLEGFVNEGEHIEVVGHLEKVTRTERQRLAGAMVEVRSTSTVVYVDGLIVEEEQ